MTPEDPYEREFMSDGSRVLLRDKSVWRLGVGLFGIGALVTAALCATRLLGAMGGALALEGIVGSALATLTLGALALNFAVLRVTVTTASVQVQFGVLGPTIPIESIKSVRVAPYEPLSWGGWGLRGLGRQIAYSTTSHREGVEIVYEKNGAERLVFVTSADPSAIERAIAEARRAGSGHIAMRVDAPAVAGEEAGHEDREDVLRRSAARRAED